MGINDLDTEMGRPPWLIAEMRGGKSWAVQTGQKQGCHTKCRTSVKFGFHINNV